VSTTGNTTACRGTTGIGATVIRTTINEDRFDCGPSPIISSGSRRSIFPVGARELRT